MKKFILGIGVLFSFVALAGNQIVNKTIPQGNGGPNGIGSLCDADPNNIVLNCGFELSTTCLITLDGCPGAFLPFWTPSGDLTYFGVAAGAPAAHSGANGAFAGQVNDLGYITQTLATTAGTAYTLTFWLAAGPPTNHFVVYWDGAVVYELINAPPSPYTLVTVENLVASVDGTDLSFGFYQPPSFWYLDDVSVDATRF